MARASKLTQEQKEEIKKLREELGMPYSGLAAHYGVSSSTIMRICRPDYAEQQRKSNREYQTRNVSRITKRRKERYRIIQLKFHVTHDKDVVDFLNKQDNVQDYVRQKILEDIKQKKFD